MESFRYPNGYLFPQTPYRVLYTIAVGGMGAVYAVMDESLEKKFVIKTLLSEFGPRPDLLERMRREARALARLNHRNIVQVIRFDITSDEHRLPYLVMELLDGRSLGARMDRDGALPWPEACRIARDVLRALEHAHNLDIIHRDIKPENIFLHHDSDGTVVPKLLDFGIVAQKDVPQGLTGDRFLGTVQYAAPEQILAEPITARCDLYAVALTLYEMLTGRSPFEDAGGKMSLARAQLETPPPPVMVEGLPPSVSHALTRCLEKRPEARLPSAAAFAEILNEAIQAAPKAPPPQAVLDRSPPIQRSTTSASGSLDSTFDELRAAKPAARESRLFYGSMLLGAATVFGLYGAFLWSRTNAQGERPSAPTVAASPRTEERSAPPALPSSTELSASPPGTSLPTAELTASPPSTSLPAAETPTVPESSSSVALHVGASLAMPSAAPPSAAPSSVAASSSVPTPKPKRIVRSTKSKPTVEMTKKLPGSGLD